MKKKKTKKKNENVKTIPKSVYFKLENCCCFWLITFNTGFIEYSAESK